MSIVTVAVMYIVSEQHSGVHISMTFPFHFHVCEWNDVPCVCVEGYTYLGGRFYPEQNLLRMTLLRLVAKYDGAANT